jgi:predicted metal-binding membrane protein
VPSTFSPAVGASGRDRVLIAACIALVTILAWAYLIHLSRQMAAAMSDDAMMAEMGMATAMEWRASDVLFTFAMWTVMMVGMMAGAALPVLLLFASASAARGTRSATAAVSIFGLGYFAVWTAFSAAAALLQFALHQAAILSPAMAASSPRVAGVILVAAGVYQLTPVKGACLTHCRSPLGFLIANWRDGRLGAFHMGARHGLYCLGCCWALMTVLFAAGVMNLLVVAALSVFVLAEKIGPAGAWVARFGGAALVLIGLRPLL